jgi:hypothetical protein
MTDTAAAGRRHTSHRVLQRWALGLVAALIGGFQLVDGAHVLRVGAYLGPPTPGPWANLVAAAGVDPFAMGPVFIVLGSAWILAVGWLVTTGAGTAWWASVAVAVLTLWYLPLGTALAALTLLILVVGRSSLVR